MRKIKFRAWNAERAMMETNIQDEYEGELSCFGSYLMKVNEREVMQYTGLKDKNGKEIYEGDILKGRKYYITVVFYKGMFSGKQHGVSYSEPLASWEMNCFEIIGNIYENPELLKVN